MIEMRSCPHKWNLLKTVCRMLTWQRKCGRQWNSFIQTLEVEERASKSSKTTLKLLRNYFVAFIATWSFDAYLDMQSHKIRLTSIKNNTDDAIMDPKKRYGHDLSLLQYLCLPANPRVFLPLHWKLVSSSLKLVKNRCIQGFLSSRFVQLF